MTTRIPATPVRAAGRPLWLALLAAAPAAWAGTPINERAAADPAGQVEISNIAGSVVVAGWDRAEVEVTGELGKGAERLEFSSAGKLTRVKVIMPKHSSRAESSDLIVKVPAAGSVSGGAASAGAAESPASMRRAAPRGTASSLPFAATARRTRASTASCGESTPRRGTR